ncbi:MAG: hypothetical protein ACFB0B_11165 [Thermonemataceae bacterium]
MKVHFKDIENINKENDGSWGTFLYNGEKFTGEVYDTLDNKINWIFDVKNGLQNGIEKTYQEGSDVLEQITENKDNMQFGVSKEFDEKGNLQSVSVVWNNKFLKTIFLRGSKPIKKEESYDIYEGKYPEKIIRLLNLTDNDLIKYNFEGQL